MFSLIFSHKYYLHAWATDMRKSFDSLCDLIQCNMGRSPIGGEVYIFKSKDKTGDNSRNGFSNKVRQVQYMAVHRYVRSTEQYQLNTVEGLKDQVD